MASLKDIRRRISSVKNTQQITKAMKMVAAAKLRRAQQAIQGARPFAEKLEELTGNILDAILSEAEISGRKDKAQALASLNSLLKQVPEPQTEQNQEKDGSSPDRPVLAFLIVTSDRGLCGAYNSNLIRFALKKRTEFLEKGYEVKPYFLGKRGADFFIKKGISGEHVGDFWHGRFTTEKAHSFARSFIERFLKGEIDRVEICYTEFRSAISQVPAHRQLLPLLVPKALGLSGDGCLEKKQNLSFIFKPSKKELLAQLLPKQVETQFHRCLAEALASEFGARMTAMDNATRNAKDMISRLSLEANRVRQASITKELMEIIGGAEALKG